MRDARIVELARRQYNRVSRQQLADLGFSGRSVDKRIELGTLVTAEEGVYALAPLLRHDEWGKWMGATPSRWTATSRS
jgi:hypothetical protein